MLASRQVSSARDGPMIAQTPVTVTGRIRSGEIESLRNLLASTRSEDGRSSILPFEQLSGTHFARIIIADPTSDLTGSHLPGNLVYVSDVDGSADEHLG